MDTITIACLATIGALCLLAICILVTLLVLRHSNKHEDLEAGEEKVAPATIVKNESIVVISDQSYYCLIGSPASERGSSDEETIASTDDSTDDSSEDTSEDSSEDSSSLDEQNRTYKVTKEQDLEKSIQTSKVVSMKENGMKLFREKKQNNLNSSLGSLNLSQMFKEIEQSSSQVKPNPKEENQKYIFESVDIETEQSEISFINIENSLEKDFFLSNERFMMSPQARKDLELIEKKIFLKSGKPSFKPFTVWGILNRFSYFYCIGLDLNN